MSIFVLVANDVPTTHFEKAVEVQIKSAGKIKFVPQGYPQLQSQGSNGVANGTMRSSSDNGLLSSVRFEWDGSSCEFGSEIVKALAGHYREEEIVRPELTESTEPVSRSVV